MLSDATKALNSPCLPEFPWSKFPFTGFFAMVAALFTLLLDFVGTQYYERKQGLNRVPDEQTRVGSSEPEAVKVFGEEESGGMHIVGMHAHAAHHRHNHPHGQDACHGIGGVKEHGHAHAHGHDHGHALISVADDGEEIDVRHVVVSQVSICLLFISFHGFA